MAWRIEYLRSARKSVEKLDPQTRSRIRNFLYERLADADDPRQLGKSLSGPLKGFWSYRVGDHRIICELKDGALIVLVVAVGNRRDIYQ